jgi:hypothetical protein
MKTNDSSIWDQGEVRGDYEVLKAYDGNEIIYFRNMSFKYHLNVIFLLMPKGNSGFPSV